MTPTKAVLPQAQPMPAAPPRAAGEAKGQAGKPSSAQEGQDFAALFAMFTSGGELAGEISAEGEAAAAGEELLPRRALPGRPKGLRPEDVLPPELLLTLYPQMAKTPAPADLRADIALAPGSGDAALSDALAGSVLPPLGDPTDQLPAEASAPDLPVRPDAMAPQAQTAASFAAALASSTALARPAMPVPQAEPETLPPIAVEPAPATSAAPAVQQALAPAIGQSGAPALPNPVLAAPPAEKRAEGGEKSGTPANAFALAAASPEGEPLDSLPPPEPARNKAEFTVIRQETILPPAGPPPAAQQAAERIVAHLQSAGDADAPQAAGLTREPAAGPTRVLHIRLDPPHLGTLTVKLTLRDDALDIKLEAAEHNTVRLLDADRDRLSDLLRRAGYAVDNLTVGLPPATDRPGQGFQAFAGAGADHPANYGGGAQQGGPQAGGAQSDAQRGGASQGGPGGQGSASASQGEEGNHAGPARSAGGDLYI